MGSTLIATSRWSVEASVASAWPLLARAEDWPRWWSRVARARVVAPAAAAPGPRWPLSWPALCGRPLRLQVGLRAMQPMEMLEWSCAGDLEGRSTWLLESSPPRGADISCRWELRVPSGNRSLAGAAAWWMIERRVFALSAHLAQDMARTLHCRVTPLREWRGSVRRGPASDDR